MIKHPCTAFLLALSLAACSQAAPPDDSTPVAVAQEESSSSMPQVIEPYPYELTVEHFRNMTLTGTGLTIGRVLEQNSVYAKYYITYLSNGIKVSGTLSLPKAEGAHKLIILNHGYIDPAVYTNGRGLRREQDFLARRGFAVLHTDYRKHAQSDPDPDLRDIYDAGLAYAMDSANAVQAVRLLNDPRIDATKVGMIGHSMGGGVTLHLLVGRPDLIDAAVLYAPVSADAWLNFDRWRMDGDDAQPTLDAMGTRETNPDAWDALSHQPYLENIADPVLLFHGLLDKDVPVEWSNDLDFRLRTLGKNIRYVTYPKEGHEFGPTHGHFITTTADFFTENLR